MTEIKLKKGEPIDKALRRLIKSQEIKNALVFCNRKRDVAILQTSLKKHGFDVVYKETAGGHTWLNWRDYLAAWPA